MDERKYLRRVFVRYNKVHAIRVTYRRPRLEIEKSPSEKNDRKVAIRANIKPYLTVAISSSK